MNDFTELIDLLAERLGGAALLTNDDFFAPKENLVRASEPVFLPDEYTERGKLMDGWESRRKRVPGYDWCILRLGVPGLVRGVVVDTTHFKGNFPESCSIEACSATAHTPPDVLASPSTTWIEVLPRSVLRGDSKNLFAIDSPWRFTHVRLNIHPDGGVARLRVHGEARPDWKQLSRARGDVDLVAVENGGRVLATSDRFFGSAHNMLMPGRSTHMGDGWETRRRRGPGHDWAILELGVGGSIERIEVDTGHFKGNFPDTCSIEICHAPSASVADLTGTKLDWRELLPRQKLLAATRHHYESELATNAPASHVRINIFPDGGVARLRLLGTPSNEGRAIAGLAWINALTPSEAEAEFANCCGARAWAVAMTRARPFASAATLLAAAEQATSTLVSKDWLEAFAHHPEIGAKKSESAQSSDARRWSSAEQARAAEASKPVLAALAEANQTYRAKFGHIYIVCASGRSADELVADCRARLANAPEAELRIAAAEQKKIMQLRLAKLIGSA